MLLRVLLIPAFIALTALKLVIDLVLRLSAWVFYLMAMMILLVAFFSYYMQLETAESIKQMVISAGMLLIIPQGTTLLAGVIEVAAEIVGDRIKSVNRYM